MSYQDGTAFLLMFVMVVVVGLMAVLGVMLLPTAGAAAQLLAGQ